MVDLLSYNNNELLSVTRENFRQTIVHINKLKSVYSSHYSMKFGSLSLRAELSGIVVSAMGMNKIIKNLKRIGQCNNA